MNPIHNLADENMINVLGWTLIHSFWQIALIGLLLKISLIFLKKKSAEIRHLFAVISLFSIVIVSLITFVKISQSSLDSSQNLTYESISISLPEAQQTILAPGETNGIETILFAIDKIGRLINANLNLIVVVWLLGAIIFSLRFAGNFWYIQRLRKKQIQKPPRDITNLMRRLGQRMNIGQRVKIFESMLVKVPLVIGHLKPAILIPVGLLSSLPYDQVEAILAHELAHIGRKDYLINIFKSVLEVVFFYHPIFWWISSTLETERENCCDDLTIQICGSEIPLRNALLCIQQFEIKPVILATAISNSKYKLLNRIMRMKTTNQFKHGMKGSLVGFLVILGGMIILATASAFSPRLSDLPGEYKTEKIGLLNDNLLTGSQADVESTGDQLNTFKPNDFKEVISRSIPDTTIKSSGTTPEKVSDKVTMEFDGNYNLISVKKDGKPLEGNEKKEYEAMAAKMKKLNEQEKQQEEQKAALELAEKELQAAQEQIEKAQQEYEKAISAYHESYTYNYDSAETNVFVWTEGDSKSPKKVREIRIERHSDFPEMPEMYSFSMPEEGLVKIYEESLKDRQKDLIFMEEDLRELDRLGERMKVIEIERELDNPEGASKVVVKTREDNNLVPTLREELWKDGILKDSDDKMNFSLSQDELEVNGKKLSDELHKKYLKLYKQTTGNKLSGEFKIIIKD